MNADDLRTVFETVLPAVTLQPVIEAAKLQERERKLNAHLLLRATIIDAATGSGGRQAASRRTCQVLDRIGARTGPAVRALAHASVVSSMLVGLVAQKSGLKLRPVCHSAPHRVHPQVLAILESQRRPRAGHGAYPNGS